MTTQQRIAQLEAMLREVEWRGASILHVGRWVCPVCRADTTDTRPPTHNPGCELDELLRRASHPLNTEPKVEIQSHIDGVEHTRRIYEAICSFGQDFGGACYYNVHIYGYGTTEKEAREKLSFAAIDLRESMVDAVGAEIL